MIPRILETEVMDSPDEAQSYDDMDHRKVNERFVADFLADGFEAGDVLDLGTGTAQIPVVLCKQVVSVRVLAVDAASSMLDIAQRNVAASGLEGRIQLARADAKSLPFENAIFDAVISNSLLHHLAQPKLALRELVRVLKPQGRLFVRDLMRPQSTAEVERLVRTYAAKESDQNQQLLRHSLHAALTLEEMRELIASLGFPTETVSASSDRHWSWAGVQGGDRS